VQVNDIVTLDDATQEDCACFAWAYISAHRQGVVKAVLFADAQLRDGDAPRITEAQYAIQFPDEFPGGHYCGGACLPSRGQYVMAHHLRACPSPEVQQRTVSLSSCTTKQVA
jgi:hypothetical protein